jgi:bacillithiol biosynthesis cysteine-adding enzyme BshC
MRLRLLDSLPFGEVYPPDKVGVAALAGDPGALALLPSGSALPADHGRRRLVPPSHLAAALRAANLRLGAGESTLRSVEDLGLEGTRAVVTGQQVAPFGGPLYVVFKALSAVTLAARLELESGRRTVPVFWAEGDDHDQSEASRVGLGWDENGTRDLVVTWPNGGEGVPIGDLAVPSDPLALRAMAAALLPTSEFTGAALDLFLEAAAGGETLSDWFCRLLLKLFAPWGLVVWPSREPSLRRLWAPLAGEIVESWSVINDRLAEGSRRIEAAGFHPQLHKRPSIAPFFLLRDGRRLPVVREGEGLLVGGLPLAKGELGRLVADSPGDFSPGVAVRPVIQDALLPSCAYVGGVSEASYLAQLSGVYHFLGVTQPAVHPRFSATLVEPSTLRLLERHRLAAGVFFREPPERIHKDLAASSSAFASPQRWREVEEAVTAPLAAVTRDLPAGAGSLRSHLAQTEGRLRHLVREAAGKAAREAAALEAPLRRQVLRAATSLLPGGAPMERAFSPLYPMAKFGTDLIPALAAVFPGNLGRHHLVAIGGES